MVLAIPSRSLAALSKAYLFAPGALAEKLAQLEGAMNSAGAESTGPVPVSAATGQGVEPVLRALAEAIDRDAPRRPPAPATAWQP